MARRSTTATLLGTLLLGFAGAYVASRESGESSPSGTSERTVNERTDALETTGTVTRIADGDTLTLRTPAGTSERVRLLGIDAPELSTTRTGYEQCGGRQARDALAALAPIGTQLQLERDRSQDARDRFGRRLAYVWVTSQSGETQMLQRQLLRAGWVRVYVYDRDAPFTQVGNFRRDAAQARAAGHGVWQRCGGDFGRPQAG
ncbi:MAG: thermonuclease family protein [Patulibacter sp.]